MSLLSMSTTSTLHHLSSSLSSGMSEGGGVNVDFDLSFVVQIALFVFLLLILKPLLFDPMLKLFEERENKIDGMQDAARKEDKRSEKALAKYEAALAKAREAGNLERERIRAEGAKKEAELMAQVRAVTASTVEQGRAAIAAEAKAAREALSAETAVLGRSIAARVLGREVTR